MDVTKFGGGRIHVINSGVNTFERADFHCPIMIYIFSINLLLQPLQLLFIRIHPLYNLGMAVRPCVVPETASRSLVYIVSSPEHEVLRVSYCDRSMS